jgi:hypothetical protein
MRRIINTAVLLVLAVAIAGMNGCLEDREVEIVLNDENCETFAESHISENFTTPQIIYLGSELDDLLEDNEVSREQILDAFLVSASYEVKEFTQDHPWDLAGMISVERLDIMDSPDTLVIYSNLTVSDAIIDEKTYVELHEDGVAKVNEAMDDYIAGMHPILRVTIINGDVEPDPSVSDPIDFTWEFCLFIQAITTLDTEIFQVF